MDIYKKLLELKDDKYALFQGKLIPNIPAEKIIGVRVPEVRKLAKEYVKNNQFESFLKSTPHKYLEENMLHGLIISEIKDYNECVFQLDKFLPYIDNWAVCDIISPKVFVKNRDKLIEKIKEWSASELTYTCRFGIQMLMNLFLDEYFKPEYLEIPSAVKLDEYYAKMMVAWFFATALAKQWDAVIPYIENQSMDIWTHNKIIQKANESFRISKEQKDYLKTLKIKK